MNTTWKYDIETGEYELECSHATTDGFLIGTKGERPPGKGLEDLVLETVAIRHGETCDCGLTYLKLRGSRN